MGGRDRAHAKLAPPSKGVKRLPPAPPQPPSSPSWLESRAPGLEVLGVKLGCAGLLRNQRILAMPCAVVFLAIVRCCHPIPLAPLVRL